MRRVSPPQAPLLVACLLVAFASQAQTPTVPPPQRDPLGEILREQREREREPVLRDPALPAPVPVIPPAAGTFNPADLDRRDFPQDLASTGPAFRIDSIIVQGDALLGRSELAQVTEPFRGRQLAAAHIGLLVARLNRLLVQRGYVTSRATLADQNIAAGVLSIALVAGRIEQIRVNGEPLASSGLQHLGLRLAMPLQAGQILRLQDIEQAADQINRVRGQQAQVQIRPGNEASGSIIDFKLATGDPRQWTVVLDNHGSQGTGEVREHLLLEQGNLFGLLEQWNLGLVTSRETNALYASVAIPWGYNTFSASRSWSEYQSLVGDVALVWGSSHTTSLAWNRLVRRDQNSKTALDLSLVKRRAERSINDTPLTPQEQAAMRLGASHLRRWDRPAGPASWTLDVGWVHGLPRWGQRDAPNLPVSAAHADFDKLELASALALPVTPAWHWRSKFAGQWSRKGLYSGDQLFAGGAGSVRGARESTLGGDRGFYLRNEAAYAKGLAVAQLRIEPYLFADTARLQALADGPWRSLSTLGVGLRAAWKNAGGELMLGRAVQRPAFATGTPWRLSLQLSAAF